MKYKKTFIHHYREIILLSLIFANIAVWVSVSQRSTGDILKVAFIDIGQGDAIFIETPSKKQMLIDGGKNRLVVSELGRLMPFGDKSIDVVMATHPDADHIGGLPEVVSRYDVGLYVEPEVESENTLDDELEKRVDDKNINKLIAKRGQTINFGDGVVLKILFPNTDVSRWETNDASIVARLEYGNKSFLLTGDSPIRVENILMSLDKKVLDVDVLKAGHHGSRTSTSLTFATAVKPLYAIISAGKGNTYGHPHKEVLNILNSVDAEILNTADKGTIIFETNGEILKLK